MKIAFVCLAVLISSSLLAQSKKELAAQVEQMKGEVSRLKTEVSQLQSENQELKKPKEVDMANNHKKASYGLGVLMASNIKKQAGDSLDVESMKVGLEDIFLGRTLKLDEQKAMMFVQEYMQGAIDRRASKAQEESRQYMEKNKTTPGIMITASGLQYRVLTSGKGKSPSAGANVTVHYTGKLVDGTVFDSSVERGQPATFTVNQVIAGWTEALQLMHEGDKWMLFIPSELAYGERGAGAQIPPHAALVFEVELIKVEEPAASPNPGNNKAQEKKNKK